jgi:hypothetical protein
MYMLCLPRDEPDATPGRSRSGLEADESPSVGDSDDNNLLDLSDWPAPPPVATLPPRRGLPPRPVHSRTLPRLPLTFKGSAIAIVVLGLGLLVAPAGSCGSVVGAWSASALPLPAETAPQLDDGEVARDAEAVRGAQAALAAWHAPAPVSSPAPTSRTVTVRRVSAREVAAAQDAVDSAQHEVDADQSELDRLLAEQEASSDPASYDGQVAAAREELDRSVATLDEARRDLATARSRTAQVVVTTTPRPGATAVSSPSPARAVLVAQLADARRLQATHLAARNKAVSDWRSTYRSESARVSAHNARVRSCAGRAGVPGSVGLGLLALGAGALVWRRVRG